MVYNDVTNTRVAAGHHLATYINFCVPKYLDNCLQLSYSPGVPFPDFERQESQISSIQLF